MAGRSKYRENGVEKDLTAVSYAYIHAKQFGVTVASFDYLLGVMFWFTLLLI